MWHLEKAILEQFNTSCLSLNDANTHFQTKLLVSTVTLFRFGRNPNENLFSGVQIVLIPVVCCRADEAVVSKQKQECEKETKEKHGAKQNMRMACIDVPVENTFSSTRVFLGSQLTNGKTQKNTNTTAPTVNRLVQIISRFQCRGGQNVSRIWENRERGLKWLCKTSPFYFVGSGLSTALLLYVEMGPLINAASPLINAHLAVVYPNAI